MQENKKEFLITGGINKFVRVTEKDGGFYVESENEECRAWFEDTQLYEMLRAVCRPVFFNWED